MTERPGNKPLLPPTDDPEPWTDGRFRYANRCTCGCTRYDPRDAVAVVGSTPEGQKDA